MKRFTAKAIGALGLAGAAAAAVASPALAHPGHADEDGILHVLSSPEHWAVFLGLGCAAAVLGLTRRATNLMLVNALLILFIAAQGAAHAIYGGVLFGIETSVAGALLLVGAGRVVRLLKTPTRETGSPQNR
ncbi:MAG: hypothetical protein AAFY02_07405 [Pseudomonadota bacterium]